MHTVSLSVLLSTLIHLQQARVSAGTVPVGGQQGDRGLAAVDSLASSGDTILNAYPNNAAAAVHGLDVEAKRLVRRQDPDPAEMAAQSIDALAAWLTQHRACVRNDCFFVTTARLLGTTVEDISTRTGIAIPQPGAPGGVQIPTMVEGLTRLGLRFRAWESTPSSGGGPIRNRPQPEQLQGVLESRAFVRGAPRTVGVAYLRPDGTGHVVVGQNPGRPYSRYTDYQGNPNGVDVTQDVRNSRIHAFFYIDTQASTGDFIGAQRPAIERMEVDEEQAHPEPAGPGDGIAAANEGTASGINLADVPSDTLNGIRANQLSESQCVSAIASLALIFATSRSGNGPRALHAPVVTLSTRDETHTLEKRSECDRLRSFVAPRKEGEPLIAITPPTAPVPPKKEKTFWEWLFGTDDECRKRENRYCEL